MKNRWIALYVENQVGVLAKVSGLFSGKSYNLDSLTVGTTEDPTVSRMTIATVSDDETFEQIKKQLNRTVEVIKVIDFTDVFVRMKEILYIKVKGCSPEDKVELFQIAETFKARVIDYGLCDTMQGRIVDGRGGNEPWTTGEERPFRSQEELYRYYEEMNQSQEKENK